MKRIFSILLVCITLFGALPFTASAANSSNPFSDVSSSDYFCDAVSWAVEKQITNGTSATTFSPNVTCTQAQIITFIWRSFGCPEPEQSYTVTDIKPTDYYYTAVLWARSKGVFETEKFEPNKSCTRATAVWYLWVTQGKPYIPNAAQLRNTEFTDVTSKTCYPYKIDGGYYHNSYYAPTIINGIDYTNYYFVMALNWATSKGITNGTSATTFSPDQTCTRAQIAAMIYRDAHADTACAGGSHNFCLVNGDSQYLMTAPTCKNHQGRYYKSCVTCGLSSKGITDDNNYDIYGFFEAAPLHSYKLCVEPTATRYGLKYCTDCGTQAHVAKLSNHIHDWQRITSGKLLYDRLRGDSTLLEYVWYFEDTQYKGGIDPHIIIFRECLANMDEAGKYYYKNGQRVGLIDDDYIMNMRLAGSYETGCFYRCKICGERQIDETLQNLYGENAIYGTYDTVYGH